jgi:hypothetical protein
MLLGERLGGALGWLSSPLFALGSAARHSRFLHPAGVVLGAVVEPVADADDRRLALAGRLRGQALVRFSAALWKGHREWMDVLGCAIRFREDDRDSVRPNDGDQDLLFATVRSPWTMPVAPLGTDAHDFLANRYFATAPFDAPGWGRVKWRLSPDCASAPGATRRDRLLSTVYLGKAVLSLEVRPTWTRSYVPIARVVLVRAVDLDQNLLRFDPFRAGRGVEPRGFVHNLRRGAYAGSRRSC